MAISSLDMQDYRSGTRLGCALLLAALLCIITNSAQTSAAANEDFADDGPALESAESARAMLMEDVQAYARAVASMEETSGAFASGLSEQLLGLGLTLQRNGAHELAIKNFKRGVHLARVNEGLYSDRQMALLQGEIVSHIALGQYVEADERQRYLYRVQARTLSDRVRSQALMQHALWQRQAYEAGVDAQPFERLVRMWSLYRLALTELAYSEGDTSPLLLTPLYGMLRAQYLISGFVGETTTGHYRTRGVLNEEENKQLSYRHQSYKQGSEVIRAIYDVRMAQPGVALHDKIDVMLMLGDWRFWHGKRSEALQSYAEVERELAGQEDAQALRDSMFAKPQSLPALAGVRALPEPISEQHAGLLLKFGVNDRGRVVNMKRLDNAAIDGDTAAALDDGQTAALDDEMVAELNNEKAAPLNDQRAAEIMRRVRQTLFRPRISDGMPVNTEELVWAYDEATW
jgi:hypothetical protein